MNQLRPRPAPSCPFILLTLIAAITVGSSVAAAPTETAAPPGIAEAQAKLQARDAAGAQTILESVVQREPGNAMAWRLLGSVCIQTQHLDCAEPALHKALDLLPGTPGVLYNLGVVAAKRVGSRIFYEAAIPWSELVPLRAKEGTVMGFAILVNDNDGKGKGYISWGDGLAGEKRPLLFPPVKLVR